MAYGNADLASRTWDEAQDWFDRGYITETQLAGFRTAWSRGAHHFSALGAGCDGPQDAAVEAVALDIAAAQAGGLITRAELAMMPGGPFAVHVYYPATHREIVTRNLRPGTACNEARKAIAAGNRAHVSPDTCG